MRQANLLLALLNVSLKSSDIDLAKRAMTAGEVP